MSELKVIAVLRSRPAGDDHISCLAPNRSLRRARFHRLHRGNASHNPMQGRPCAACHLVLPLGSQPGWRLGLQRFGARQDGICRAAFRMFDRNADGCAFEFTQRREAKRLSTRYIDAKELESILRTEGMATSTIRREYKGYQDILDSKACCTWIRVDPSTSKGW